MKIDKHTTKQMLKLRDLVFQARAAAIDIKVNWNPNPSQKPIVDAVIKLGYADSVDGETGDGTLWKFENMITYKDQ